MGTLLIRSASSAARLASQQAPVVRWRSVQVRNLLPGPLEYERLYLPTGLFPPFRPEKVLASLAGLPPGRGFVLGIASCGAVSWGLERESAPDLPTGVSETGPANGPGQGEPQAVPGPSSGGSRCCFSDPDDPSLAGSILPIPCSRSSPLSGVSRCPFPHLSRGCSCTFCSGHLHHLCCHGLQLRHHNPNYSHSSDLNIPAIIADA